MITAIYAALLTFLMIALSINVIKGRRRHKIALGDDHNEDLQKRIRAQANFSEYTPMFLILLGSLENFSLPNGGLHLLGLLFITSRLSHAYGLTVTEHVQEGKRMNTHYRAGGMAGTFITMTCCALLILLLTMKETAYLW